MGTALLGRALAGRVVAADSPSSSALTGKVTSQAESAMEGVLVGAKKAGSTITTWVVSNAQGNLWYSDFNSQFLGKLDPKTGKVVEYPVPQSRTGVIAQGGLQIDIDKQGRRRQGSIHR